MLALSAIGSWLTAALWALHVAACAFFIVVGVHRLWLLRGARAVKHGAMSGPRAPWGPDDTWPAVLVQLPLYNEPEHAARVLRAALAFDYPRDKLRIQVLDDSTDHTPSVLAPIVQRAAAQGFSVQHVRRTARQGYKAGALAAGLAVDNAPFIAVFDADFVPAPDFLRRMLPAFAAPDVGWAQARWTHLNPNANWRTRGQAAWLDAHFWVDHAARSAAERFFNFNGTAGIWRRSAIDTAGGWNAATLTEDLDLSLRASLAGYRGVFLPAVTVPAELPVARAALRSQQHRWAKGALQVTRLFARAVLAAPRPWAARADAAWLLAQNVAFAALWVQLVTLPALWFASETPGPGWNGFFVASLVCGLLPHVVALVWARTQSGAGRFAAVRDAACGVLLGPWLAGNNARAALHGLLGVGSAVFTRTPKGRAQANLPGSLASFDVALGAVLAALGGELVARAASLHAGFAASAFGQAFVAHAALGTGLLALIVLAGRLGTGRSNAVVPGLPKAQPHEADEHDARPERLLPRTGYEAVNGRLVQREQAS